MFIKERNIIETLFPKRGRREIYRRRVSIITGSSTIFPVDGFLFHVVRIFSYILESIDQVVGQTVVPPAYEGDERARSETRLDGKFSAATRSPSIIISSSSPSFFSLDEEVKKRVGDMGSQSFTY